MAHKRCLLLVLIAIVMAASIPQAFALKCWQCDSVQNRDCGDPFAGNKLTDPSYIDCPPRQAGKEPATGLSTCIKTKIQDKIIRKCANSEQDAKAVCEEVGAGVAEFCERCNDADGCNGAPQYGPAMILIAIPAVILMKISSF